MNPFLKLMVVPKHTILGRQLLPMSAYHVATLDLFKSPYYVGGTPQPTDAALFVNVCQTQWTGRGDELSGLDPEAVRQWAETIADADWNQATEAIREYRDYYIKDLPEAWDEEGHTVKTSGIPSAIQCVTTVLIYMPGIPEADVWNMPFNRLVAYKMAIAENHGLSLISERQRQLIELDRQEKEKAAANV